MEKKSSTEEEREVKRKESVDDKITEFKKHSGNCIICGKESLFDGCSIQMVAVTESGKIIDPMNPEGQEGMASVLVPLCAYHTVLSQSGLIALTQNNECMTLNIVKHLEELSDRILNQQLLKIQRSKQDPQTKNTIHVYKTILEARKFQSDMDEQAIKMDRMEIESACEKHKDQWKRECKECFANFKKKHNDYLNEMFKKDGKKRRTKN